MPVAVILFCILFVTSIVGIAYCTRNLQRIPKVHKERMRVLKLVSAAADEDINATPMREWRWRYDAMDEITFHEMVNRLNRLNRSTRTIRQQSLDLGT